MVHCRGSSFFSLPVLLHAVSQGGNDERVVVGRVRLHRGGGIPQTYESEHNIHFNVISLVLKVLSLVAAGSSSQSVPIHLR